MHTDVAVHKPAICGSADCTTNTHKTVLFRTYEQRRRRRVSLKTVISTRYLCYQTWRRTPGPLLTMELVFTHTISSHLRNPHLARTSRPLSKPSPAPLPIHSRTNEGSAERAGMGRSCRSAHEKDEENGGSMSMTSNLACCNEGSWDMGR